MAQLVVRNLEDDVKRGLQRRAMMHGRSMEAEVRDILRAAVAEPMPPPRLSARASRTGSEERDWTHQSRSSAIGASACLISKSDHSRYQRPVGVDVERARSRRRCMAGSTGAGVRLDHFHYRLRDPIRAGSHGRRYETAAIGRGVRDAARGRPLRQGTVFRLRCRGSNRYPDRRPQKNRTLHRNSGRNDLKASASNVNANVGSHARHPRLESIRFGGWCWTTCPCRPRRRRQAIERQAPPGSFEPLTPAATASLSSIHWFIERLARAAATAMARCTSGLVLIVISPE